jgi:hypothetical protein
MVVSSTTADCGDAVAQDTYKWSVTDPFRSELADKAVKAKKAIEEATHSQTALCSVYSAVFGANASKLPSDCSEQEAIDNFTTGVNELSSSIISEAAKVAITSEFDGNAAPPQTVRAQ